MGKITIFTAQQICESHESIKTDRFAEEPKNHEKFRQEKYTKTSSMCEKVGRCPIA